MIKTEVKVKREMVEDQSSLLPYLERFVAKINYNYGKQLAIQSWEVDTQENDDVENVKTVALSLK